MNGTLNIYCLDCHDFVQWRKLMIYRQDGHADWRLAVFCGCGEVTDERIMTAARAEYDECLDAELETMHRILFEAALGRSGNLYFETLAGGRGDHHPILPEKEI